MWVWVGVGVGVGSRLCRPLSMYTRMNKRKTQAVKTTPTSFKGKEPLKTGYCKKNSSKKNKKKITYTSVEAKQA